MLRRLVSRPSVLLLGLVVIGSLLLVSGCQDFYSFMSDALNIDGGGNAEAQNERRIETFIIVPNTFLILSDLVPTITVDDNATIYTNIDGSISFTPTGDSLRTFQLVPEDTVIERPAAGTVTIDRSN